MHSNTWIKFAKGVSAVLVLTRCINGHWRLRRQSVHLPGGCTASTISLANVRLTQNSPDEASHLPRGVPLTCDLELELSIPMLSAYWEPMSSEPLATLQLLCSSFHIHVQQLRTQPACF